MFHSSNFFTKSINNSTTTKVEVYRVESISSVKNKIRSIFFFFLFFHETVNVSSCILDGGKISHFRARDCPIVLDSAEMGGGKRDFSPILVATTIVF